MRLPQLMNSTRDDAQGIRYRPSGGCHGGLPSIPDLAQLFMMPR